MRFKPMLLIGVCLWSCGRAPEGTLRVTAYGESYIEQGIPASEVEDGWALVFRRFDVVFRDVVMAGVGVPLPESVNLAQSSSGEGHVLGAIELPAKTYSDGRFTLMALSIEGTARKGDDEKFFTWRFDQPMRYQACEGQTEVLAGHTANWEITLHADHLLFDSLVAEEPKKVFQPLAASDTNSDGRITQVELAAKGLGSFDPGSEGGINNLWEWLSAQVAVIGHVNGEGHCQAQRAN